MAVTEEAAKKGFLRQLYNQLWDSDASSKYWQNFAKTRDLFPNTDEYMAFAKENMDVIQDAGDKAAFDASLLAAKDPLKTKATLNYEVPHPSGGHTIDTIEFSPLKSTGGMLWQNIKAHPGVALGTAANAAGNLAGLVDNDKLLGQVLGTVGGAVLGGAGLGLTPLGTINLAMAGGNLGMLFDKLRSKRAQMPQQTYGPGTEADAARRLDAQAGNTAFSQVLQTDPEGFRKNIMTRM